MADVRDNGSQVQGSVAHDAVDVGNPVKIGGRARGGIPANVAADDRIDAWFTQHGSLVQRPEPSQTVTVSRVNAATSSTALNSPSSDILGVYLYNDSDSPCRINFGAAASATAFVVKMEPYDYYEVPQPMYIGQIYGIWESATGAMQVTELE